MLSFPPDSRFIAQDGQWQNNEYREREGSRYDNRSADFPRRYSSIYFFVVNRLCDHLYKSFTHFLFLRSLFTAGSAYCTRLSAKAYSENAQKTTKEELWSLLRAIHENPKLSSKEKRRLMGQFYKGHPEIFVQYFGNRLSTVNMLLQWYLLV